MNSQDYERMKRLSVDQIRDGMPLAQKQREVNGDAAKSAKAAANAKLQQTQSEAKRQSKFIK
jgi:hypothetical protein